jgi:hypothetical protein
MRWEGDGKLKGEKSGRERRVEGREEWKGEKSGREKRVEGRGSEGRCAIIAFNSVRVPNIGDDKLPLL